MKQKKYLAVKAMTLRQSKYFCTEDQIETARCNKQTDERFERMMLLLEQLAQ